MTPAAMAPRVRFIFKVSSPCMVARRSALVAELEDEPFRWWRKRAKSSPLSGWFLAKRTKFPVIESIWGAKVKQLVALIGRQSTSSSPDFTCQLRKTGTIRGRASPLKEAMKLHGNFLCRLALAPKCMTILLLQWLVWIDMFRILAAGCPCPTRTQTRKPCRARRSH